ncbi:10565_t:CDS:2 [Gigaspora margarita]|uniref:10565_t:CDS:1 n=1 Tax=Gigaspora margarita TaxID=4874 RepID=A0ABN7UQZ7_GIGMA|nr:10565_t:CDS:2 [Gigaspora margarita]
MNTSKKALHKTKEAETKKRRKIKSKDTKGMIKSIIKQRSVPVILNNIKQEDDLITNKRRIKKEIEEHFTK